MTVEDPLLKLLTRLKAEDVEYVLVGGQAVRLNGFPRATEDIDLLVKATRANGERIIRALDFLNSARQLDPAWFAPGEDGSADNIRVADDLLIDLLLSANGQTYEALQPFVRELDVEGTPVRVLNIEGLLKTKTNYREKDLIDRQALMRIQQELGKE